MKRTTDLYEVRYHGKEDWEDVSEFNLLQGLQEIFEWVSPAIQQILDGQQVETLTGVYRLKAKYL
jgi:hypothetical protein